MRTYGLTPPHSTTLLLQADHLQLPLFPMIMRRAPRGRHMHAHVEPVAVRPQASAHKLPRLVWHRLPPSSK